MNLEESIAEEQIKRYAERWKELQAENSSLRMMISGNLLSVQEYFLDYYFMNALNNLPDTFKICKLVGNVMGEYELMLGDLELFLRVKNLINNGVLVLEEEWQDSPMNTLVRKKSI